MRPWRSLGTEPCSPPMQTVCYTPPCLSVPVVWLLPVTSERPTSTLHTERHQRPRSDMQVWIKLPPSHLSNSSIVNADTKGAK